MSLLVERPLKACVIIVEEGVHHLGHNLDYLYPILHIILNPHDAPSAPPPPNPHHIYYQVAVSIENLEETCRKVFPCLPLVWVPCHQDGIGGISFLDFLVLDGVIW